MLDNLTLLFSLALVSGLMAASLAWTSAADRRDGLRLWAAALALESLAWSSVALRELAPLVLSLPFTHLVLVGAQSLKLAAIHTFRGMPWSRWQCALPLFAMGVLLLVLEPGDTRARLFFGSLIFVAQMAFIARALRHDRMARGGRAWWLIYGSTVALLGALLLRTLAAAVSAESFALPQSQHGPGTVQLILFVSLVALDLLGALGFILLVKERAEQAMQQLAMTDGLTGLLNRRAFMERAGQAMANARRHRQSFALLMLDIDHFKRINDTHGHAAGDAALVQVCDLVRERLRNQDAFGRYGGEEFCILLPETDEEGAFVLAEALRQSIAETPLRLADTQQSITVSIGISVCHAKCADCTDEVDRILNEADRALYLSKKQGRNRTVLLPLQCEKANATPL